MPSKSRNSKESGRENGLTPIPPCIHWPATTDGVGGQDELDDIAVEHFLNTLAQVALAVASRKIRSTLAQDQPGRGR
jgi:hypothetical protein